VEISREARQRAAELDNVPGLSSEQVAEIRHRIATGAYDAPEVTEAIARRMIDCGEF
jgi:anti-sigma28 factor (negative regulator of flagellin synthesis)